MNWLILLYNVLIGLVIVDAAASTLAAWYIFRLKQRFGLYIAFAFVGVAVEASVTALAMGLAPGTGRLVVWMIVLRILSRALKTVTMVALTLYLLGYLNGHSATKTGPDAD